MNNMQKEILQEEHPILFLVGLVCLLNGLLWFALKIAVFLLEDTEFINPDYIMPFLGFIGVLILVCLAAQSQHKE